MAGLLDGVLGTLMNDQVTGQIANKLGVEKTQAQSVLGSALPILMQALNKNASTPEGASALENALKKHEGTNILDNAADLLTDSKVAEGGKILNHILGEKRNTVEQFVSKDAGLSSSTVSSLLSSAAPLLMGALAGQKSNMGSGIGSLLSGLTGEMQQSGVVKDQSFIEKLLDRDNDGSIMDDVADMGMSFLGNMMKK